MRTAFCSRNSKTHGDAMRICNSDRSQVGINRSDAALTPTGFAEIIGDDLPIFHVIDERGSFP
jgi:hypothetical protein